MDFFSDLQNLINHKSQNPKPEDKPLILFLSTILGGYMALNKQLKHLYTGQPETPEITPEFILNAFGELLTESDEQRKLFYNLIFKACYSAFDEFAAAEHSRQIGAAMADRAALDVLNTLTRQPKDKTYFERPSGQRVEVDLNEPYSNKCQHNGGVYTPDPFKPSICNLCGEEV